MCFYRKLLLPSAEGHCKEVIPDDVLALVAGHSQNRDWGWNRRLLESSAFLSKRTKGCKWKWRIRFRGQVDEEDGSGDDDGQQNSQPQLNCQHNWSAETHHSFYSFFFVDCNECKWMDCQMNRQSVLRVDDPTAAFVLGFAVSLESPEWPRNSVHLFTPSGHYLHHKLQWEKWILWRIRQQPDKNVSLNLRIIFLEWLIIHTGIKCIPVVGEWKIKIKRSLKKETPGACTAMSFCYQ